MKVVLGGFISILLFLAFLWMPTDDGWSHPERINGVSLVNPYSPIDSLDMAEIRRVNASWVAVIPFAFCRQGEPGVFYNDDRQWWGERMAGCKELVGLAQRNGFRVMMKPHVWMRGDWIGEFTLETSAQWEEWERQYAEYILAYARLSEELGVELLCIGTELKLATSSRPAFWKLLISQIKAVYHGKLTYAANWDHYREITFWDELDYIGVDAYFPLSYAEDPDQQELAEACETLKETLKDYAGTHDQPMLFTEFGFRSAEGAVGNHWEITRSAPVNLELQVMAYEALMACFWKEKWFAGGFLWKWHFVDGVGGVNDNDFTPQNKPVEATIRKWYGRSSL